ncbi:DUF3043 domain-containing protein [Mycolicibacterium canariasense]|uniref:DUF3043 domain-containing protein n=1 Tax=Mycolicibacterium canariasense TaxID=228230 RepID=UPI0007896524|nr:DUF3043 domain-containing protein [Mycolicibacterium canariasense]MCV7212306.1 DUF3043 domain-containing protein [Mycolicibacterium canariasense]ORU98901.1 hypothetical protein AWB94_28145 [Mycolicibacterium canariasense]
MNLLGRKKDNPQPEDAAASAPASATAAGDTGLTAPKGRPTPKRSEAARRRGPVAPAPLTSAEARKRRKELAASKPKLSREERKAEKVARRAAMTERRERMMAGDDAYLLPRDKGPVRRYARDIVDSRRNLLGLFMPVALALVLITLAVPAVEVQRWVSYGMPVLLVVMAIDGVLVGRRVNRMVDEKFPSNTESGFKLGFYAASRASQLRRMRAPRPMVNRGDDV